MESATELRIRACLIREGVCGEESAGRVAATIAEEIALGDDGRVSNDYFDARMAQIDTRIAELSRDMAEFSASMERQFREFLTTTQEIERQRDERERQRDVREREREEKWEKRYERFQRVVYAALGAGVTGLGILIAVLGLVA